MLKGHYYPVRLFIAEFFDFHCQQISNAERPDHQMSDLLINMMISVSSVYINYLQPGY